MDFDQLLARFNRNAPAEGSVIAEVEAALHAELPAEYKAFLRVSNGGEGFFGEHPYAIFWKAEELIEMNLAYQVAEAAPGLFIFGSNGGGEAFGFDTRTPSWPVFQIPFIVLDWDDAISVGGSFADFLHQLENASEHWPFESDPSELSE